MKKIILNIIGMQIFADGGAALITKESKDNPSKNGVHVLNAGQVKRIAIRTLGVLNPVGLKHFIELSNGNAKLEITAEECKAGVAYTKSDGSKGTYTKDWTKYSNHEVKLAPVAQAKLAEMSMASSFDAYVNGLSGVSARPTQVVEQTQDKPDTAV